MPSTLVSASATPTCIPTRISTKTSTAEMAPIRTGSMATRCGRSCVPVVAVHVAVPRTEIGEDQVLQRGEGGADGQRPPQRPGRHADGFLALEFARSPRPARRRTSPSTRSAPRSTAAAERVGDEHAAAGALAHAVEQGGRAQVAAGAQRVRDLQPEHGDERQAHDLGNAGQRDVERRPADHVDRDDADEEYDPEARERVEAREQPAEQPAHQLAPAQRAGQRSASQSRGNLWPAAFSALMYA